MKVIEGGWSKPEEEKTETLGVNMLRRIAEAKIDQIEEGQYLVVVETSKGIQLISACESTATTYFLLDRLKMSLLLAHGDTRRGV